MATFIINHSLDTPLVGHATLMTNSSDKLSRAATMDDLSESVFGCEVLLAFLPKVPHTEKSCEFISGEEMGHISLNQNQIK
uniref:Uncharacterized protein n=1 Tax=Lepeophtheirus salmonis TaxID=72036 RepID=A0A0K2U3E3_LEPSM